MLSDACETAFAKARCSRLPLHHLGQVTKELAKLDECISNIDESLFTNMEAEEESSAVNARSGGSGAMGSSRPNAGGLVCVCVCVCVCGGLVFPFLFSPRACMRMLGLPRTNARFAKNCHEIWLDKAVVVAGGGGGGDRDRKRKSGGGGGGGGGGSDKYAWVVEGALCEVEWDGEYWQAKILRVKVKNQSSSGSERPFPCPPTSSHRSLETLFDERDPIS